MMFLYAALTALLCISFSSGYTTPILPEIEETTQASDTTQALEIQTSDTTQALEIQTSDTTQALEIQTSDTTQALEIQTSDTTQALEIQTSDTTQALEIQTSDTTQTSEIQTTETETTQTVNTTQTSETTQTLETTQAPSVYIQKSGQRCTYEGRASDVMEIGCRSYKRCVEGEMVTYWCTQNRVLERDSMTCVRPGTSNTGCSSLVTCIEKTNGLYANVGSKCQTYYWCYEGINFAHMYCPANLVFNEAIQSCDFPVNVEVPCGTKVLQ